MNYRIEFSPAAERYLKKIKDAKLSKAYFGALEKLAEDPFLGQAKRGDLSGVYGYDLRHNGVSYEIAYRVYEQDDKLVVVILAGTRENFYAELKRYMKSSGKIE